MPCAFLMSISSACVPDDIAAVVEVFRHASSRNRHQESTGHSERGSLRPGKSKGTDSGLPGGKEIAAGNEGADSLLRWASRRGQDFTRKIDCSRNGAQVRAHFTGRNA